MSIDPRFDKFDDTIVVTTTIHLSWLDRLRVLVHGQVHGRVRVDTERVVGRTRTTDLFWVQPVRQLVRNHLRTPRGEEEAVQSSPAPWSPM